MRRGRDGLGFLSFQLFQGHFIEDVVELCVEVGEIFKNKPSILAVILTHPPSNSPDKNFHCLIQLFNFTMIVQILQDSSPFLFQIVAQLVISKFLDILKNFLHVEDRNPVVVSESFVNEAYF